MHIYIEMNLRFVYWNLGSLLTKFPFLLILELTDLLLGRNIA